MPTRDPIHLPEDALTVFALGGWEALIEYTPIVQAGEYKCPDTNKLEGDDQGYIYHRENCGCHGAGAIQFGDGIVR